MKPSRAISRVEVVFGPLLLVAMAGALVGLLAAANGPVRVVTVSGVDLTEPERHEVRGAVASALSTNYLSLDLDAIVQRVQALSWPHGVSVRRVYPRGVAVQVSKEVFVARWGGGGVLNSEGVVIKTPAADVARLPLLDCAIADGSHAMQVYQALIGVLAGRHLEITALREDAIGEWTLTLASGLAVHLGADDMLGRLERFVSVYDGALATRVANIDAVDARYRNGVAVAWHARDESPTTSAAPSRAVAMDR